MGFFSGDDEEKGANKKEEREEKKEEFVVSNHSIVSFPIQRKDFIILDERIKEISEPLFFIDGGIQKLYTKGNTAFYIIKIGYVRFISNRRKESKIYQTIVRIKRKNPPEISFKEELPFLNLSFWREKRIESADESFDENSNQLRRILEIQLASHLASIHENSSIIIDGTLFWHEYDKAYVSSLIKTALKRNNRLIGISKNTSLFTNKGNDIRDRLALEEPKGVSWLYFPLFFGRDGLKAGCCKFHPRAPIIFRFDILNVEEKISNENLRAIKALALNSRDGSFLGYPYGLIYIDRIIRVSNKEAEYFKTKYFVSRSMENLDAHTILDNIS